MNIFNNLSWILLWRFYTASLIPFDCLGASLTNIGRIDLSYSRNLSMIFRNRTFLGKGGQGGSVALRRFSTRSGFNTEVQCRRKNKNQRTQRERIKSDFVFSATPQHQIASNLRNRTNLRNILALVESFYPPELLSLKFSGPPLSDFFKIT